MTSWKPSSNIFRDPDSLVDAVRSVLIGETNKNDKSDDGEGLDAVQPKAVKKKFKDRKDKDIDNDGDTDSSDEYLHKRRKAVSKAMKESDVDEAKSSFRPAVAIKTLKKEFEPMRGKKISMDSAKKLSTIMNKFANDKDMLIQLMKADIPFVSQGAVTRLISKHGMKGAELNKMMKEDVDLDEGFINLGGAKVKDDEKSILQHIKKTFPNVKKVKKDPQHGWIPVFEDVDLDEVFNGTKQDLRKIARATDNALKKRSAQIQKMLKSKTNEKGRGLTDFEFDHISDEGDAIAAELVKIEAPLAADLLDTTYVSITILSSERAVPIIPSPKYISNNPASTSCRK